LRGLVDLVIGNVVNERSMSDMGIPGLSTALQIRSLIEQLRELRSQQDPEACDFLRNQGCDGNAQQEFERIVAQIQSLSDQFESLGLCGNADSGNGRLKLRITA
jgi:hypothetical protein